MLLLSLLFSINNEHPFESLNLSSKHISPASFHAADHKVASAGSSVKPGTNGGIRNSALQESLKHYQALGLQPQLRFEIKDCTWDDILDMIATSREDYERKAAGLKGLFRKAFRKAGDHSVRIAPLFEMIPGDEGLSVLRGGLGWILTV